MPKPQRPVASTFFSTFPSIDFFLPCLLPPLHCPTSILPSSNHKKSTQVILVSLSFFLSQSLNSLHPLHPTLIRRQLLTHRSYARAPSFFKYFIPLLNRSFYFIYHTDFISLLFCFVTVGLSEKIRKHDAMPFAFYGFVFSSFQLFYHAHKRLPVYILSFFHSFFFHELNCTIVCPLSIQFTKVKKKPTSKRRDFFSLFHVILMPERLKTLHSVALQFFFLLSLHLYHSHVLNDALFS